MRMGCTTRSRPSRSILRCRWSTRRFRRRRRSRRCTVSQWRCRRKSGLPGTPSTRGSRMRSEQLSRTPSACCKHASPCKCGRLWPSVPHTCTDQTGTAPDASSTRGSMSLSASWTPTRWQCTSSQQHTARRRSHPTSSCQPRMPSTRDPSSAYPPTSGPGPPGTCATRRTTAQTLHRQRRTCRMRMGCTTRLRPSRSIPRCRWSRRRCRQRRRSRRRMVSQ